MVSCCSSWHYWHFITLENITHCLHNRCRSTVFWQRSALWTWKGRKKTWSVKIPYCVDKPLAFMTDTFDDSQSQSSIVCCSTLTSPQGLGQESKTAITWYWCFWCSSSAVSNAVTDIIITEEGDRIKSNYFTHLKITYGISFATTYRPN